MRRFDCWGWNQQLPKMDTYIRSSSLGDYVLTLLRVIPIISRLKSTAAFKT